MAASAFYSAVGGAGASTGPAGGASAAGPAPAASAAGPDFVINDPTGKTVVKMETFEGMGVKEDLLRGIHNEGYEKPTGIQRLAIVPLMEGRDVIVQAQSGTGKTGTFAIGLLQRIDFARNDVQALVVCHTKELALQTATVIGNIGQYLGCRVGLFTGGTSVGADLARLREGIHVAVGTLGRLLDLNLERGKLRLDKLLTFIIDEADELLGKDGSLAQLRELFEKGGIHHAAQVAIVSATMTPEVLTKAKSFMTTPVSFLLNVEDVTLEGITQYVAPLESEEDKFILLEDIYSSVRITQSIIFCNTKRRVEELRDAMTRASHTVSAVHSGMDGPEREMLLKEFRSGTTRVLITTDLYARGIDSQTLNLAINYDVPSDPATFIHRVGRSARNGRKGLAITFVNTRSKYDVANLTAVEDYYKVKLNVLPDDPADASL